MALKTYVLVKHNVPSPSIYIQANQNQRVKLDKRPVDHAYMQITFVDREGKSKTIRLKLGCDEIYQDKQIKDHGILANEKFTQREKESVRFHYETLTTGNLTVQKFLEASPEFEDFWKADEQGRVGYCDDIQRPKYRLYDPVQKVKSDNKAFLKRLEAANMIAKLKLREGQDLLLRLYGSFYKVPPTIEEVQNALVDWMDDQDEDGLENMIRASVSIDEKMSILIGRSTLAGILTFDEGADVKRIRGNKKITLMSIDDTLAPEQRRGIFAEFLMSDNGKQVAADLQKDLEKMAEAETAEAKR